MKKLLLLLSLCFALISTSAVAAQSILFLDVTGATTGGGGGGVTFGGGLDSLTSGTLSASASQVFSFGAWVSTYRGFLIKIFNLNGSSADISLQVSADGSTFDAGATDYGYARSSADGGQKSQGTTAPVVYTLGAGTSGYAANGWLLIDDANNANFYPKVQWFFGGQDYFNNTQFFQGIGSRLNKQITKAVKLIASSGTISCTYAIYGYK